MSTFRPTVKRDEEGFASQVMKFAHSQAKEMSEPKKYSERLSIVMKEVWNNVKAYDNGGEEGFKENLKRKRKMKRVTLAEMNAEIAKDIAKENAAKQRKEVAKAKREQRKQERKLELHNEQDGKLAYELLESDVDTAQVENIEYGRNEETNQIEETAKVTLDEFVQQIEGMNAEEWVKSMLVDYYSYQNVRTARYLNFEAMDVELAQHVVSSTDAKEIVANAIYSNQRKFESFAKRFYGQVTVYTFEDAFQDTVEFMMEKMEEQSEWTFDSLVGTFLNVLRNKVKKEQRRLKVKVYKADGAYEDEKGAYDIERRFIAPNHSTFANLVESNDELSPDNADLRITIQEVLAQLSKEEVKIVGYMKDGYTKREIDKLMGSRVDRKIKRIKQVFAESELAHEFLAM